MSVLLGSGTGTFALATDYGVGDAPWGVLLGDLNGDGQADILASNYADDTISILTGNGDGTFNTKADFTTASTPTYSAIGDLNADGKQDVVTVAYGADSLCVFVNTSPIIPNYIQSYFVPEAGSVGSPTVGASAVANFRMCPNNDGLTNLPNHARVRVVVRDAQGAGIASIAAADIAVVFNGGTAAQGFSGAGADSVIANSTWNGSPECPDLRTVTADAPTDEDGQTYITFSGSTPGSPGVATRDPERKWGHYDSEMPIYVLGTKLQGRLTTADSNGSYVLRIKSYDVTGGLGATSNQGETVTSSDYNFVSNNINVNDALSYWRDFNSSGSVTSTDANLVSESGHLGHDCDTPNNP